MAQPQKTPSPDIHCPPEDLGRITSAAWANFDSNELTITTDVNVLKKTGEVFMACVSLKGNWNGAVLLICPHELAIETAAGIFGKQDKETSISNAEDMLGEVANMIAGGVMEIIDTSATLSLPVVAHGADITMGIQDGKIATEVSMTCKSRPVHVMVLETHLPIS